MPIDQQQFWRSNTYQHPALTDEMLSQAEAQLGVKLPPEYVALLRIQNGGDTHGFGHPIVEWTRMGNHVPLYGLAGIVTDPELETAHNILDTAYLTGEWGLPERQALLSGQGHWWISLDYRKGDVPSVAWLDVDRDQDYQIAPTFAAFLEGLRPLSEFDD